MPEAPLPLTGPPSKSNGRAIRGRHARGRWTSGGRAEFAPGILAIAAGEVLLSTVRFPLGSSARLPAAYRDETAGEARASAQRELKVNRIPRSHWKTSSILVIPWHARRSSPDKGPLSRVARRRDDHLIRGSPRGSGHGARLSPHRARAMHRCHSFSCDWGGLLEDHGP